MAPLDSKLQAKELVGRHLCFITGSDYEFIVANWIDFCKPKTDDESRYENKVWKNSKKHAALTCDKILFALESCRMLGKEWLEATQFWNQVKVEIELL